MDRKDGFLSTGRDWIMGVYGSVRECMGVYGSVWECIRVYGSEG